MRGQIDHFSTSLSTEIEEKGNCFPSLFLKYLFRPGTIGMMRNPLDFAGRFSLNTD
jgi:hypothetical protein